MRIRDSRPARLALIGALLTLGGCTMILRPAQIRGNNVDPAELSKLVAGKTTQTEATTILGSPTAKGTFDQNDWYYIGEVTKPAVAGTESVLAQDVVVLAFDNQGVLQNVSHLTQKNALNVPIVSRTTPSPGTEAGFFQQLLGGIGRLSPGGLSTSQAPSGGVPIGQ